MATITARQLQVAAKLATEIEEAFPDAASKIWLWATLAGDVVARASQPASTRDRILDYLRERPNTRAAEIAVGIGDGDVNGKNNVRQTLGRLKADGLVDVKAKAWFVIADAGGG